MVGEALRVSVKCDLENIARRIHVGSANKLPLEKLIDVYFRAAGAGLRGPQQDNEISWPGHSLRPGHPPGGRFITPLRFLALKL